MIDRELINRKLVLIGQDLREIASLAGLSKEEYLGGAINQAAAERYLERMIGRMIDINFHLLVESGQAPPPDYFQSFIDLADLGVYKHEFASRIAKSAGLRNRIVHEYDEIDASQVYGAIKAASKDIPEYMRHVEACLTAISS